MTGGNGYNVTYDANGDMLSDGKGNSYSWDARRRLTSIRQGPVIVASFQYDATGRRISRTDVGGLTTAYLYDGLNPIQETQGSTVRSILTGLGIDERYARDDTGGRTYFLTDALGSTVALTNASRTVMQQYSYDPYGNVTLSNPGSTLTNPYQYTGRENDGNGLYYYRARYYSPNLQRFISEDPIGLAGGANQFAYVGGNPVSNADPFGLADVVVSVWSPSVQYRSVAGHVMMVDQANGGVLTSQFPHEPGGELSLRGPNVQYSAGETRNEEGRPADYEFDVYVPNDAAFYGQVNKEVSAKYWFPLPLPNTTNCSVAAYDSLEAGGVFSTWQVIKNALTYGTPISPSDLARILDRLSSNPGSGVTKRH